MSKNCMIWGAVALIASSGAYLALKSTGPSSSRHEASKASFEKSARRPPKPDATTADLLAGLRSLTEREGSKDLEKLEKELNLLARKDPQALAGFADSLPGDSSRQIILHRIARAWTNVDPKAAAEWATGLRNPAERDEMVACVCYALSQSDPLAALQLAENCHPPVQAPALFSTLVQQVAERDYPTALEWVERQPAGERRDELYHGLVQVLSERDSVAAAHLVAERIPAGPIQDESALVVVSRWAKTDPDAAREWAEIFEDDELRERSLREISLMAMPENPDR